MLYVDRINGPFPRASFRDFRSQGTGFQGVERWRCPVTITTLKCNAATTTRLDNFPLVCDRSKLHLQAPFGHSFHIFVESPMTHLITWSTQAIPLIDEDRNEERTWSTCLHVYPRWNCLTQRLLGVELWLKRGGVFQAQAPTADLPSTLNDHVAILRLQAELSCAVYRPSFTRRLFYQSWNLSVIFSSSCVGNKYREYSDIPYTSKYIPRLLHLLRLFPPCIVTTNVSRHVVTVRRRIDRQTGISRCIERMAVSSLIRVLRYYEHYEITLIVNSCK